MPLVGSNGQVFLFSAQSVPCVFHDWVSCLQVMSLCCIGRTCVVPALYVSLLPVPILQVTLVGSNGREYLFLAKPKDDLRKDVRIMEVAGVLNRLFAKEPASRRRNLYLRRYSMIHFGGNCSRSTG